MRLTIALLVACSFPLALASLASAQAPFAPVPLHLQLPRRPLTVQPVPDPRTAEEDADAAVAEIQARERRDELVRQLLERPFRRPDLDRDVIGGIQSRNLTDALRRR